MNRVQYSVSNLVNSQCRTQVKNALDKVKGVQKVGISIPDGTIEVEYNEPADVEQIRECIKKTGFTIE